MDTYQELIAAGTPTRAAAALVGVPRATATRKLRIQTPAIRRGPSNRLTDAERARVLEVVNSKRFIDLAPIQIFTQLPGRGNVFMFRINVVPDPDGERASERTTPPGPASGPSYP